MQSFPIDGRIIVLVNMIFEHAMSNEPIDRVGSYLPFRELFDVCSTCAYVTFAVFNRKELPITDTLLKLIAAAAIMGLSKSPIKG